MTKLSTLTAILLLLLSPAFAQINSESLYASIGKNIEMPDATFTSGEKLDLTQFSEPQLIQITQVSHELGSSALSSTIELMQKREFDNNNLPLIVLALTSDDEEISKLRSEDMAGVKFISDKDLSLTKEFITGKLALPLNIVVDPSGEIKYIDKGYKKGTEVAAVYALELARDGKDDKLANLLSLMEKQSMSTGPGGRSANPLEKFIGTEMPDYSNVEVVRGEMNAEDKFVLVEFWATWCGPCVRISPHLEDLYNERKDEMDLISITDEDKNMIVRYLKKKTTTYPVGIDADGKLQQQLQVRSIPSSFLVNKEGVIVWAGHPAILINDPDLLDELLAGEQEEQAS